VSDPKEMTTERLAEVRTRAKVGLAAEQDRADLLSHIDALTARVEKAELERGQIESVHQSACRKLHRQMAGWKLTEAERDAQKARADASEKKLQVLVEAIDLVAALKKQASRPGGQSCNVQAAQHEEREAARRAYEAALQDARGGS